VLSQVWKPYLVRILRGGKEGAFIDKGIQEIEERLTNESINRKE